MEWKIPEEIRARSLKTVQWMMVYQVITYSIPLTCESKKSGIARWRLGVREHTGADDARSLLYPPLEGTGERGKRRKGLDNIKRS